MKGYVFIKGPGQVPKEYLPGNNETFSGEMHTGLERLLVLPQGR